MATKKTNAHIVQLHNNVHLYNATADREQNYLGKKIAEARTGLGLSLSAFKKLLSEYGVDVSVPAINKWELGNSAPTHISYLLLDRLSMWRRTSPTS